MSQEEVEAKISGLLELHAKWTALRDAGGSGSGLRTELQASLKALELDLEDLEDALSIAKGDRTQEKESVEQREAYIVMARSRLVSVADSVAGSERNSTTAGTAEATEPAGGTATPSAAQAAAPQTPATPAPPAQPADDPVPRCQVPNCSVM